MITMWRMCQDHSIEIGSIREMGGVQFLITQWCSIKACLSTESINSQSEQIYLREPW